MLLVVNRDNNMGDCLCQMRGLYELQKRDRVKMDFISCHYLHYVVALHSGLFKHVWYGTPDYVNAFVAGWSDKGYDNLIEFKVDWTEATQIGILKAWVNHTLGFIPSTNKPLFIPTDEERVTAKVQYDIVMRYFNQAVSLNLESVSSDERGFQVESYSRVMDLIPDDTAIFYPLPIDYAMKPLPHRHNLIQLPGYPIGVAAALYELMDANIAVHSGPLMLAYAVSAPNILQISFDQGAPKEILQIPETDGDNINFQSNAAVDWGQLQNFLERNLRR